MSSADPLARPGSDQELMAYLDDELDEAGRRHVEQRLAQSAEARDKLAGLELAGELLRAEAAQDERGDGIAAAVMARLDTAEAAGEPAADASEAPEADGRRGGAVLRLPRTRLERPQVEGRRAANDNARTLYLLAAAAAAVAAGLFFWSRTGSDDIALGQRRRAVPPSAVAAASPATTSPAEPRWPAAAASAEPVDEPSTAVEVAAVDFGSHSGSVFYVATGPEQAAPMTAVVWVTDDVTGDGP